LLKGGFDVRRFYLIASFIAFLTLGSLPQGSPTLGQTKKPPTLAERAAPRPIDIAELPDSFSEKIVASGITGATALAVAADGRVFVCEQTGALRVIKEDVLLDKPFLTVSVDSSWERGLIGVTLHPEFPKTPYVYVCYVAPDPHPHHRVSRFTARGDVAVPDSEVILLVGDDQRKLGGKIPNGHQGGAIRFGQDRKLYIGIGECSNERRRASHPTSAFTDNRDRLPRPSPKVQPKPRLMLVPRGCSPPRRTRTKNAARASDLDPRPGLG